MYSVELYVKIRRAVMVEGKSEREVARYFGIHRNTVKKMCQYASPPGYRRKSESVSPKLAAFTRIIDAILEADKQVHAKQRHSAVRILERLRDEHGFTGGYTIVRNYVYKAAVRQKEMFVPLAHLPGHAQVDFGEADGYIGGKLVRFHYFCLDLPHSDGCFVKAYPTEDTESFLDGHIAAFAFIDGVPQSILYDNTKIAVAKILGNGKRERTKAFSELQSHYLFEDKFGRPGKGNDKGNVEGMVGYSRRHFMVPLPIAADFDAFDACHKISTRVSSQSLVRYRTNDYSVPTQYGHREVLVKGYVDHIDICLGADIIARHVRSYGQEEFIYNPLHYLALLERKPRAFDQAAPLQDWVLPDVFDRLRRLLEVRMERRGRKEYIQVLRLLENFSLVQVEQAIKQAMSLGAVGFDAIKHLILCAIERRPAKLDMTLYPYLPNASVESTEARSYLSLLQISKASEQPSVGEPL